MSKLTEVTRHSDDLRALIGSVRIACVNLDKMEIRNASRFTGDFAVPECELMVTIAEQMQRDAKRLELLARTLRTIHLLFPDDQPAEAAKI